MTDESLQDLINIYSDETKKGRLKTLVDNGKVSEHVIFLQVNNSDLQGEGLLTRKLDDYYLFTNEANKIVGVVYDMKHDLHAYVVKKFRNKGLMSNILKNEILPYLFTQRNEIQITIADMSRYVEASLAIAQKLGFEETKTELITRMIFVLTKKRFEKLNAPSVSQ